MPGEYEHLVGTVLHEAVLQRAAKGGHRQYVDQRRLGRVGLFVLARGVRWRGAFNQHSIGRLGLGAGQDRTSGDNSSIGGKDSSGNNAVLNPIAVETNVQRKEQIHYRNETALGDGATMGEVHRTRRAEYSRRSTVYSVKFLHVGISFSQVNRTGVKYSSSFAGFYA